MPSCWQAAMMRTAISPRLAIRTDLNIVGCPVGYPGGAALFEEGTDALLAFGAGAQAGDGGGGGLAGLGGAQLGGGDDLVDQADGARAGGVEALGCQEEGTGMRLADLAEDEGGDDGGGDAQAGLGEAEAGVVGGDGDVADGGEAGAAAERGAVDAADDGLGAGVYGAEHVGHAQGVGHVLVTAEIEAGAHPVEVGAGTEAGAVAAQDDGAHTVIRAKHLKGGLELGDEPGVEGVVNVGARERDVGGEAVALDAQVLVVAGGQNLAEAFGLTHGQAPPRAGG